MEGDSSGLTVFRMLDELFCRNLEVGSSDRLLVGLFT